MRPYKRYNAFTLSEVIITVAILGLIGVLLLFSGILNSPQKAQQSDANQTAEIISKTATLLAIEKGLIPKTLSPLQVVQSRVNLTTPAASIISQNNLPTGCKALLGSGNTNFYQANINNKNQQVFISQQWVNQGGQDTGLACVYTPKQRVASLSQFTRGGETQNSSHTSSSETIIANSTTVSQSNTANASSTTQIDTAAYVTPPKVVNIKVTYEGSTAGIAGATHTVEVDGSASIGGCSKTFSTPALFSCSLPVDTPLAVSITSPKAQPISTTVQISNTTNELSYVLKIQKSFSARGSVALTWREWYNYTRESNVISGVMAFGTTLARYIRLDKYDTQTGQYLGRDNNLVSRLRCIKDCDLNDGVDTSFGIYAEFDDSGNIVDLYKGAQQWHSPVKLSLQPADAFLNSTDHFGFDLDGFSANTLTAVQTPGGLNVGEAWLVYDRQGNGIWHDNVLDNDDVFGDHQGQFKNGYEDLAKTFKHEIKYDDRKHPYLDTTNKGLVHYVGYLFGRWFNHAPADASIELKLLTAEHKLLPIYNVAQKLYLNYSNVKEIDPGNANAIFQRAFVEYKNGHIASSADQWFNLGAGSYTKLPKAEKHKLLKELHLH